MTTAINPTVTVEATGLVRCCAWCLSAARLAELHRAYRCTDSLCAPCAILLEQATA